jgi:ribokinase
MATDQNALARPPRVVVIGSINMDLVTRVERLPRPGQTVRGRDLVESPGGKGANQAVAAARLGAHCTLVGRVGDDAFGEHLLQGLINHGVHTEYVRRVGACSSGVALIGVEDSGENAITIIPGANGRVSPDDIAACEPLVREADVVLLQLEIPNESVAAAINLGRRHGVRTILNPAPATGPLPATLLQVDVLCPNESEAEVIAMIPVGDVSAAQTAARRLRDMGAGQVLVTLGERGVLVCNNTNVCEHIPAFPVAAVDTTGAGDAFTAGVGVGLAQGWPLEKAIRLGCAAGALATTRRGAQQAMPAWAEVKNLLDRSSTIQTKE